MARFKPYASLTRSGRARRFIEAWECFGNLYDPSLDEARARHIREDCEELGIPMGYGRIGRAPTILDDDYVVELFTKTRHTM